MPDTSSVGTLTQDAKQVFQLFRPFFGFDAKNRARTMAMIAVVVGCLTSAIMMVYIQNAFSALNTLILTPGISLGAFGWGVGMCLFPVISYAAVLSLCTFATSWLSDNLSYELSNNLISKWIDNKAFYGIKFIHSKDTKINPGVVLGNDVEEICSKSTKLFNTLTQTFLDFTVSAYQLWRLSSPLALTIFSMTIAIPAYMVIAAMGYAIVYSLIVHLIDKNLRSVDSAVKQKKDSFNTQLHHVEEHAETIAMKMGNIHEKNNILKKLQKLSAIYAKERLICFLLDFSENISSNVSYLFGLALSAPGIIAGKLDPSNAFGVAQYFTGVVKFFTWKKDNTKQITKLTVSLDRFNAFKRLMEQWDSIQAAKKLKINKGSNRFAGKNVTIFTPDDKFILNNSSFTIPKGNATVIQGPSGVGKTTLFRCLADLWPYVEGELILPADKKNDTVKIHYIPQQAYFPGRSRLIDAFNYPNDGKPSRNNKLKIIKLMKQLAFKQETINCLDIKDDWDKRLSGGEKQRVAIVGAIIKNPDIVFIDEGTNGLDPKTKGLAERALKTHLKGKTIVAIDHHANSLFYDYALKMNKAKAKDHATIELEPLKSPRSRPFGAYRTK